jgi:hypothetical protein
MYKQSTPSCNAIRAVNPSYTPGHAMNLSGSASMFRSFWTADTGFEPLVVAMDPISSYLNIQIPTLSFGKLQQHKYLVTPIWNHSGVLDYDY